MRNAFLLEALRLAANAGRREEPLGEAEDAHERLDPPEARAFRERLVDVVAREVRSPDVLAALRAVPRHRFVPGVPLEEAYGDHPVPIGHGATICQPTGV